MIVAVVASFSWALAVTADAADKQAVRVVKDVAYLQGANYADNEDKLDLYLPDRGPDKVRATSGLPVIVSFYGGALTAGDKNQQAYIGQRFAAAGIATAVVNYRLSPGVMHPASPAHHLHAGLPPTLILYADGDDEWRRQQNTEAAQAMKAAGNANVTIAMINGRTHNTIWSRIASDGDEAADRIIQFIRATTASRESTR
jgi:acetyl esterase/lipase